MIRVRGLALAMLGSAGCSLVYDTASLRGTDDAAVSIDARGPDAPPPDAPPADAMPPPPDADHTLLDITGASPERLYEGAGSGGGRPVLVTVTGASIAPDVEITVAWADDATTADAPEIVAREVLPGGDSAVIAIRVPVNAALAAGVARDARLTFTQLGGAVVDTLDLPIDGLAKLTLSGSVTEAAVSGLYSTVDVAAATHVSGTNPVRIRATGDITVRFLLDVDASGRIAGPHGCNGGTASTSSSCGGSGGGVGFDALIGAGSGGGGGGFGSMGEGGDGDQAGSGGAESGSEMLVPITTTGSEAGNRGNGGGGGGTGTIGGVGGDGGGGGGVLLLEAGGAIVVTGSGALRARGGNGGGSAGGGGGGSGGALIVRGHGGITSTGEWLSAPGGTGANATHDGGNGGVGRIRVDAASGSVPAMATTPAAIRGPAWESPPLFTTTADVELVLRGQPGRTFDVRVDDLAAEDDVMPGAGGTAPVALTLAPGVHEVCAICDPLNLGEPEARTCIQVAYVPVSD